MNEENRNSITYDEGWESVTNCEYPVVGSSNPEENEENVKQKVKKKKDNSPKQLLITIQLIVCILIALAALVIKTIGGDFYAAAHDMYYSSLNNSAIFDNSDNFNLNNLFTSATQDEIQSTKN
ncbi:hypothetical protein [Ruminococcus sp.]|uniref:hypothetical protein n=1 Tax=Ruminococcus sp. TaxID=41978 RepID=UPI002639C437|nr:hypothetical protein [Ruminococcus sp.]MDD6989862.1 hypothetical protein [Ruminococcus sp.]MDY6201894.1 hypothetical protein [Ruminococcus sp.]